MKTEKTSYGASRESVVSMVVTGVPVHVYDTLYLR